MAPPQITNIAFGGTGTRNPAYAGALMALEERGLCYGIKSFAGTSAGAIVAALACVGYTPEEILQRVVDLDYKLIPGGNILLGPARLLLRFGWFHADYLVKKLGEMIAEKMGDPGATLEDCERRSGKQVRLVGVNLSRGRTRVFPDLRSRHMPLVEAVRISMSIPLFFEASRYDGELYVDGGLLWNVPVEMFDDEGEPFLSTLGVVVRNPLNVDAWRPGRTTTPRRCCARSPAARTDTSCSTMTTRAWSR
jgi:NTE family protein